MAQLATDQYRGRWRSQLISTVDVGVAADQYHGIASDTSPAADSRAHCTGPWRSGWVAIGLAVGTGGVSGAQC
jgi:hypothetical protein